MARQIRLTNNSDESDISTLLSGDSIFSIPYFQRSYKWKIDKIKQLERNILDVIDNDDFHFLGAIIVHGRRSNPSDPNIYEVIDGQQRITTLILYICALVKTLCILKEYSEAAGLFQKFLVIGRETKTASNLKLQPCKEDRAQFNNVYKSLLSDAEFREKLGSFKPQFLPSSGPENGALRNNYLQAIRFLSDQVKNEGLDRIREITKALLEHMSVVQIDVWDPANGPKIFDSLNSRQEPMTIGDLVRNEVFSRVAAAETTKIEQIDEHFWQPFYKNFQRNDHNLFDRYFFPYGLIQDSNMKKSEVYSKLRTRWEKITLPEDIISALRLYQNAFLDLLGGTNLQSHNKTIHELFKNLFMLSAPGSTYPFLMQLSNSLKENQISEKDAVEVLQLIESFLVRRAICGHEPTGLHAVFKRLWADCSEKPTKNRVNTSIRTHKTVVWPTDDEFKSAIRERALYGSTITPYFLLAYDKSLGGDQPENIPWIEHVLPDKPAKKWFEVFTEEQHANMKDRLANLIPLTEEMNRTISNNPYSEFKREKYLRDSMFKSARDFANRFSEWRPQDIDNRGEELANWATKRWPY